MSGSVVEKRYAKALFEIASEKNLLKQTEKELELVEKVLTGSPELWKWLHHPSTNQEQQKKIVANSFQSISPYIQNFLFVLIDKKRLSHLSGILKSYRSLMDEALGVVKAKVTSAFPLTKEEKEKIVHAFEPIVGKKLILEEKVDSDLLGGAVVQIGDRLFDGSLRTKLDRFREKLAKSQNA